MKPSLNINNLKSHTCSNLTTSWQESSKNIEYIVYRLTNLYNKRLNITE